jgi:hypothetical protein
LLGENWSVLSEPNQMMQAQPKQHILMERNNPKQIKNKTGERQENRAYKKMLLND